MKEKEFTYVDLGLPSGRAQERLAGSGRCLAGRLRLLRIHAAQ